MNWPGWKSISSERFSPTCYIGICLFVCFVDADEHMFVVCFGCCRWALVVSPIVAFLLLFFFHRFHRILELGLLWRESISSIGTVKKSSWRRRAGTQSAQMLVAVVEGKAGIFRIWMRVLHWFSRSILDLSHNRKVRVHPNQMPGISHIRNLYPHINGIAAALLSIFELSDLSYISDVSSATIRR